MISNAKLKECLGRLSALRFFPTNEFAIVAIGEVLQECADEAIATDTVRTMLLDSDWPGPGTLRSLIEDHPRSPRRMSDETDPYGRF